jgi:predicted Zn-dependent peptidase
VALKGDVERATLAEVRRLRDERLVVSNRVTVCVAGGLDAGTVFGELEKELGGLKLTGSDVPAVKLSEGAGEFGVKWDLEARHFLMTWPIPDFRSEEYADLMVAAQGLNMRLNMDAELRKSFGLAVAGVDLATPEGTYFYVSVSLRPGVSFEKAQAAVVEKLKGLAADRELAGMSPEIGKQMASMMIEIPDAAVLKAQTPAGMSSGMMEGNVGLQLGSNAHRFGSERATVAKRLERVNGESFAAAVRKYLGTEKAAVFRISN